MDQMLLIRRVLVTLLYGALFVPALGVVFASFMMNDSGKYPDTYVNTIVCVALFVPLSILYIIIVQWFNTSLYVLILPIFTFVLLLLLLLVGSLIFSIKSKIQHIP